MIRTRTLALLGTPLLLAMLAAAPAQAHSGLVGSTPEDGASIEQLDDEVVLRFSEEVREPVMVVVTDPEGSGLQEGDAVVDGAEVRQAVEPATVAGVHTIAYRVVSADGHPVTGQLRVTVEAPADATTAPAPDSSPGSTGGAATDDSSSDAAPASTDDSSADRSTTTWVAVGAAVLAVLAALVLLLARRRKA